MKPKSGIVPLDTTREFLINELFFSTTDRRGIISSGNAVFARVSEYRLEEMVGRAHNMIRHPDMPRAVFRLFWEYLQAGRPVAAYVKNLASGGSYYWVLALAAPLDDGYLSVRLKPSGELFAFVRQTYAELRAIERDHDARGDKPDIGTQAAGVRLAELLKARGFASYDAFMRAMLREELGSRDRLLRQERRTLFPELAGDAGAPGSARAALRTIYCDAQRGHAEILALSGKLEASVQLNAQLNMQSRSILRLIEIFRFTPLNVAIKSAHLGDAGRSLGVIARHLGEASAGVVEVVSGLTSQADAVSAGLGEALFNLAWARLQFEMVVAYYGEMFAAEGAPNTGARSSRGAELQGLARLRLAFSRATERSVQTLREAEKILRGLDSAGEDLRKAMVSIQVIHVTGLVESSRLADDGGLRAIFDEIRSHIDATKKELEDFDDVIGRLGSLAHETPAILRTLSAITARMRDDEHTLAAVSVPATPDGRSMTHVGGGGAASPVEVKEAGGEREQVDRVQMLSLSASG